ncbi:MAG TPA: hypothetical protein VGK86_07320 [Thermoanaerobaculia bacterium]
MEQLRIRKEPLEVELVLAGVPPRRVELFLAEHGSHDFNRQRVLELVDPAGSFLPVRDLETGEWESLNSRAVVWIGMSGSSIDAEGSGDELFEHRRSVRVALVAGDWLEGEVLYSASDGGPRLVDHLNRNERYFRLWRGDRVFLVNKEWVLRVVENGHGTE